MNKKFWDERYQSSLYAYGKQPNTYFKECLDTLSPGTLFLPGEGEGRNAVYAAEKGWQVMALDQSAQAKSKAIQLATSKEVTIDYLIEDWKEFTWPENHFDALAIIYFHVANSELSQLAEYIFKTLKPEGICIIEYFDKKQSLYQKRFGSGGPKDVDYLPTLEMITEAFSAFEVLQAENKEIHLSEGSFHNGLASVNRLLLKKK